MVMSPQGFDLMEEEPLHADVFMTVLDIDEKGADLFPDLPPISAVLEQNGSAPCTSDEPTGVDPAQGALTSTVTVHGAATVLELVQEALVSAAGDGVPMTGQPSTAVQRFPTTNLKTKKTARNNFAMKRSRSHYDSCQPHPCST
ncbi:hypothetical protein BBJ28_00020163 [Nothophytophthora sp. Chile5]|nr:hypothetical protein BBJ28_00020163 [Nothophytophthora sp. Chile5]